jgi:hypothetical protein
LFEKVSEINVGDNLTIAYFLAAFCGLMLIIGQIATNNGNYNAQILVGKIRSQFIFLIFTKLSRISQYTAKSQ